MFGLASQKPEMSERTIGRPCGLLDPVARKDKAGGLYVRAIQRNRYAPCQQFYTGLLSHTDFDFFEQLAYP